MLRRGSGNGTLHALGQGGLGTHQSDCGRNWVDCSSSGSPRGEPAFPATHAEQVFAPSLSSGLGIPQLVAVPCVVENSPRWSRCFISALRTLPLEVRAMLDTP